MSIFQDDWRQCLREQYKYVIRTQDKNTEGSLTGVMYRVGFTDDELAQLRVEATMHVDDMPEDFQPDMDVLNQSAAESASQPTGETSYVAERTFEPHPAECQCPQCVDENLVPHDEDGQPIEVDPEEEAERRAYEQNHDDDDGPQQLTLFG